MTAAQRGAAGEELAAAMFRKRGYTIAARNYHCRFGELDLVAVKGDALAFVEVRTRRLGSMVSPAESVTPAKRKKVIAAAYAFLEEHPWYADLQPRFDLFLVEAVGEEPQNWRWELLENAFSVD